MIHRTILTTAILLPGTVYADVQLHSPYDPYNVPSTIIASGVQIAKIRFAGGLARPMHCEVTISLTRKGGSGTGRAAGYTYRTASNPNYKDRTVTCNGIVISLNDLTVEKYNAFLRTTDGAVFSRNLAANGMQPANGDCEINVSVGFGTMVSDGFGHYGGRWEPTGGCGTVTQPPASCSLETSGVLQHESVPTGRITSIGKGWIRIACSSPSSVNVRVTSEPVYLSSGTNRIDSKIYINEIGIDSWTGSVSQDTRVDIISTINDIATMGGEYSGSAVVTANWD